MVKNSFKHSGICPMYIEPIRIAPDEYFVPLTSEVVEHILPHYIISNYGRIYNIYENKFMAPHIDAYGYLVITFYLHDANFQGQKAMKIHRNEDT